MNGAKAFFDNNILLSLYGGTDRGKQARAKELSASMPVPAACC